MGDKSPKNREQKKPKADKKVSSIISSAVASAKKPK